MTISAKEANKLSLDRLSAKEAKSISNRVHEITLDKVYAAINKTAKKGKYKLYYYFTDRDKYNVPSISTSLRSHGFAVYEAYDHHDIVDDNIYNFIIVSWDKAI